MLPETDALWLLAVVEHKSNAVPLELSRAVIIKKPKRMQAEKAKIAASQLESDIMLFLQRTFFKAAMFA